MNNVAKHAQARRVQIRLSRTPGGGWELRIADDGRGLSADDRRKPASFGLRGMAERVRALGGELRVDSEVGRGVVVTARVGADGAHASGR
jgi:signal transduction histidine kinase